MVNTISIKDVLCLSENEGQNHERVQSIAERCAEKFKKNGNKKREVEVAAGGIGLAQLSPFAQPLKLKISGNTTPVARPVQAKMDSVTSNCFHQAAKVKSTLSTSFPKSEVQTDRTLIPGSSGKHVQPTEGHAIEEKVAKTKDQNMSFGNESFAVPHVVIPDGSRDTFIKERVKQSPAMPHQQQSSQKVLELASAEKKINHGETPQAEMTWHFKSWGENDKHNAKLTFTDLSSPDNEVNIIPSTETVRSALLRQHLDDAMFSVQIESAATWDQDKENEHHSERHHEEESEE